MITTQPSRPLCSHCKFTLSKPNGKSKHGFQKWHKYCVDCAKAMYNKRFKHIQHKKMQCEECEFVPQDKVQLDLVSRTGRLVIKRKVIYLLCVLTVPDFIIKRYEILRNLLLISQ